MRPGVFSCPRQCRFIDGGVAHPETTHVVFLTNLDLHRNRPVSDDRQRILAF